MYIPTNLIWAFYIGGAIRQAELLDALGQANPINALPVLIKAMRDQLLNDVISVQNFASETISEHQNREINAKLIEASKNGNLHEIYRLVKLGANINTKQDLQSPLTLTIAHKQNEAAKYLALIGADVNAKNKYNAAYSCPLSAAVEMGNKEMVIKLIKMGAHIDGTDKRLTPLHIAISKNNLEITQLLLEQNPDLNRLDYFGNSYIIRATLYSKLKILKLLVDHGANVNSRDAEGNTALLLSIKYWGYSSEEERVKSRDKLIEVCQFLLSKGANPCLKNNRKETAVKTADDIKDKQLISLLEKYQQKNASQNSEDPKTPEQIDAEGKKFIDLFEKMHQNSKVILREEVKIALMVVTGLILAKLVYETLKCCDLDVCKMVKSPFGENLGECQIPFIGDLASHLIDHSKTTAQVEIN